MKITKLVTFATLAVALAFATEGCKKKPVHPTVLPGQGITPGNDNTTPPPIENTRPIDMNPPKMTETNPPRIGEDGIAGSKTDFTGWPQNREIFKAYTVHFEFDRSVVKASEASKVDAVATQFKVGDPGTALLVEGHCDERGTPEYNRALGERRALAIREYLVRAGVNPEKIHTVSFGKDKPVAFGHDEAAWAQNRRGEFILLTPPK